jgi:hypothetical protein
LIRKEGVMPRIHCFRILRVLVLAVPVLLACDSTEPVLVGSVSISPTNPSLPVGSSIQLVATVVSASGSAMSGHAVAWSSSHDGVASVSPAGLVTAKVPGTTQVRATAEGKSATVTVTVNAGPCTAARTTGSIVLGQSATGSLDPTDCRLDHLRAEGWNLQLSSAAVVRIVMTSPSFPPGLLLTDRQLNIVAWSDWSPDRTQLVAELPAGQYIVWATSWADDPVGSYQLAASEAQLCSAATTSTIAVGQTVAGSLGEGDCIFFHGSYADGFRLDLPVGQGLQVDLTSASFDALLVVTDRAMNVLYWDDDSGDDRNARIRRRFPAGEYIVWVLGYGSDAAGAYQLSVAEAEIELCPTIGQLQVGQTVHGTLSATGCLMDEHWYTDPWLLSVSERTTLRIDLTSNHFDTVLIVEDEHGDMLAWDDDGGEQYNSRLVYTFEPGDYRVVATSYSGFTTGAYQLSATAVAGSMAAERVPSPDAAAEPWLKAVKP